MIVTEAYDGTFVITGIYYSELEDLFSAWTFFSEIFPFSGDADLYGGNPEPMRPIQEALRKYQGNIKVPPSET